MRRRPLLFIAVGFVTAILIEYYLGTVAAVCTGAALSAAVFYMQKQDGSEKKRIVAGLVLISYFLGGTAYFIQSVQLETGQDKLLSTADLEDVAVHTGTVREVERKNSESGDEYLQMVIETEDGCILVKYFIRESDVQEVIPGRRIEVTGTASAPQGRRNPGCFDYALYLKSRNIPVTMTADRVMVSEGSPMTLSGKLYMVKESFISSLDRSADAHTAALMRAIMFGDKGELDEEELETFQRNGTAHILAVSGLHIGIIYGFILKIWTMIGSLTGGLICGRKGLAFFCFNTAFFGCYMVMADFSPSVVRAVIMVLLHLVAQISNRRYDLGNASLAVLLLVLLNNPFMLFNAGFQMSFLAVLTLVLLLPFVKNIYSGILLSSLVIQIGLGPFIIYSFNYLSLLAVLVNVPVIFLAGFIVPAGLVTMALDGTPFFDLSAKAVQVLCEVLRWVNDVAEIRGITNFQVPSPPLWMLSFYYLCLLMLATEEGRLAVIRAGSVGMSAIEKTRARILYMARVCAVLLLVSVAFAHVAGDNFERCNLTFVDVGQGDCICMKVRSGIFPWNKETYLIDGGGSENYNLGKKALRPYLLKNGSSHVDAAFVTHLHTDHYKGICELCREKMVRKLFVYEGNRAKEQQILQDTGLDSADIVYIRGGQTVSLGEGGLFNRHNESVEVLWPGRKTDSEYVKLLEEDDENSMSLILRIHFGNDPLFGRERNTNVLVTGDIDQEWEEKLVEDKGELLKSTILKVAHHGSRYSSSEKFLETVKPEIAMIQVGKNTYGHPSTEVLERLDSRGIQVYRNDLQGAVGFEIKRGEIKRIRRMIE